jgi:hypothetical protein
MGVKLISTKVIFWFIFLSSASKGVSSILLRFIVCMVVAELQVVFFASIKSSSNLSPDSAY